MIFRKYVTYKNSSLYAVYYKKNNTLYYNVIFNNKLPRIIIAKL